MYIVVVSSNYSLFFASESLQPYKTRPQTSSLTANRRICAALGLKNPMSSDKTKTERQKIETARRKQKTKMIFVFIFTTIIKDLLSFILV